MAITVNFYASDNFTNQASCKLTTYNDSQNIKVKEYPRTNSLNCAC